MLIKVPHFKDMEIKYLVLDFNGTLAYNGRVTNSTKELLKELMLRLEVFVVTADTYGTVKKELSDIDVKYHIISKDNGTNDKEKFVLNLGKENTVAIGNGQNDLRMLKSAEIGICIVGNEGCYIETLIASDIIINDIDNALKLLLDEKKLIATLRK
ncbi:MAG: HAD family hydrolase [Clostridia bacterium]